MTCSKRMNQTRAAAVKLVGMLCQVSYWTNIGYTSTFGETQLLILLQRLENIDTTLCTASWLILA